MPLQCPLIVITMSTSKVLKELNELKVEWKKQYLQFTPAQKERYAELLNKRREIVRNYYKNDLVFKPNSSSKSTVSKEVK
jgi:ribulose bisphosphate carboxylase small subunit